MNTPSSQTNPGRGMAIFLLATGIGHFAFPAALDGIVPNFLPGSPRIWTYASGLAELVIAASLISPTRFQVGEKSIRLMGAWAALVLFVIVFPANINMAVNWSSKNMPAPVLGYGRLPLQLLLFYWAWSLIKKYRKA